MAKSRGMLPDEYMKSALIEVWPESPLDMDPKFSGRNVASPEAVMGNAEVRPDYYVAVVRRSGSGQWHIEVLKAQPSGESHIPGEVIDRIIKMRQRIMSEQRSARSRDTALARMADGHEPFQSSEAAD